MIPKNIRESISKIDPKNIFTEGELTITTNDYKVKYQINEFKLTTDGKWIKGRISGMCSGFEIYSKRKRVTK